MMPEFHWSSDLFDQLNEVHLSMLIILILCHIPCHMTAIQNISLINHTEEYVYSQPKKTTASTPISISFNSSKSNYSEIPTNYSLLQTIENNSTVNDTVNLLNNASNDTMVDSKVDSNVKQNKRDIKLFHNETTNTLEDKMRGPDKRKTYKEQKKMLNLKKFRSEQPDTQYDTINPPSKIKKILQRYPAAVSSPVFNEFFSWNEKCMAVPFSQPIKVEEHELREALALKENSNMNLRDDWMCESMHILNKFCFGVCRSFRYPIQHTSSHYQPDSLSLNAGPIINSIDKSARDMIVYLKKSSQTAAKTDDKKYENDRGRGEVMRIRQRSRSKRSVGFFCSACVPFKVKYHEVSIVCQPNSATYFNLGKTQDTTIPETPSNIMLFFLNHFGITPNINVQSDNSTSSGTSKNNNAILKTLSKPYLPKGFYKEGMNVTIVKRVSVVESCNCQPCSSHDMFL